MCPGKEKKNPINYEDRFNNKVHSKFLKKKKTELWR